VDAWDVGRGRYPGLALPFDTYARRVLELVLLPRGADRVDWTAELAERLRRSGGPDLYLAVACEERVSGAWEAFRDHYEPKLRSLARAHGARGFDIGRVAADVLGELSVPRASGRRRTGLGAYAGAGSLLAWLTVVLRRRMSDERRDVASDRRTASGRQDREHARKPHRRGNPSEEMDPVVIAVDGETCTRFGEALRRGIGALTNREREALAWRFRQGLSQTEVARRMRVGEPRVSRLLDRGVSRLRAAVKTAFPGERWEELDRLWMALHVEVGKALGRSPGGSPTEDAPAG
jgi:RNA polymerase sigma factor (sigma-70 family)